MKRKTKILLISYVSAVIVSLAVALLACRSGAGSYENRLDANYRYAFGEVLSAVRDLDSSLKKSAYASSPSMESAVCTEIYCDAQMAEMAIGVLPVQSHSLEKIAGHIGVVGDYAYALSRAAAEGGHFSRESLAALREFSGATSALYEQLGVMQQAISDGAVSTETHSRLTDALNNLQADTQTSVDTLGAEMEALEEQFGTVPALIYDGAYADRSGTAPRALEGRADVSEDEARSIAARFLELPEDSLTAREATRGAIPCWNFEIADGDDQSAIAVTIQGGEVLYFYSSCPSGETKLDHEAALQAAEAFLTRNGYENMKPCSYEVGGNAETLVFSWQQDDVLCYPDQIRVKVCLESGKVLSFEAEDYLAAHTQRTLPADLKGAEAGRGAVPEDLKILREQTALLQTAGKQERLCYEYLCEDQDGTQCLIYVNSQTGEQERILLVQQGGGSVLWI